MLALLPPACAAALAVPPRRSAPASSAPATAASNQPATTRGHARNRHRHGYDLARLAQSYAALAPHLRPGRAPGSTTVDFSDTTAVASLNSALMAVDYEVDGFEIPDGSIAPGVPGRADYIHLLADLLADDCGSGGEAVIPQGDGVRGLDIGCGATCVYPLLGRAEYGWSFVGCDTSAASLAHAQRILERAGAAGSGVQLRRQREAGRHAPYPNQGPALPRPWLLTPPASLCRSVLRGVMDDGEAFAFTMCNPPFYSSAEQAAAASARKWHGLSKGKGKGGRGGGRGGRGRGAGAAADAARRNFGGSAGELWCAGVAGLCGSNSRREQIGAWPVCRSSPSSPELGAGGERQFVATHIRESAAAPRGALWFTSRAAG